MAGKEFTCARKKSGQVVCWGNAARGKLGNGATAEHNVPVEVDGVTDATAVALGANHSCALRRDGTATCWGKGYYSGNGDEYRPRGIPAAAVKDLAEAVELRATDRYTCALKKSGEVLCFRGGVPAYVDKEEQENARWLPLVVKGLPPAKVAVAHGYTGVALLRSGQAVLWNSEAMGLGYSSTKVEPSATLPIAGVTDGIDIAAVENAACVLRRSGQISCLRFASFNSFDKKNATKPGAVTVIPDLKDATQVSAGGSDFCAVRKTGEIACFGYFDLPSPVRPNEKPAQPAKKPAAPAKKEPPRTVTVRRSEGFTDATMVAVGSSFHCALLRSGEVACRGSNEEGQLGNGEHAWSGDPVRVKGISDAVHIAAASNHVCAARKSGRVACWGSNEMDQVGHKDAATVLEPTPVKGLP
jgi:alpha-tubulin suppressor-like RCC1 family protein